MITYFKEKLPNAEGSIRFSNDSGSNEIDENEEHLRKHQ
jgi:hypothetical protein